MWFNTLLASAGGSVLNAADNSARRWAHRPSKALTIMQRLATSAAADPSLSVQKENDNRLAMESGTAAFQLNYPFVYPSMKTDQPEAVQELQVGALSGGRRTDEPAHVTIGGINLAVSSYSKHPNEAFEATLCLRNRENQKIGAIEGGVPPSHLRPLRRSRRSHEDYPFRKDIQASLATAAVRPLTPGLPEHLDRDLARGLAARRHRPAEDGEEDDGPARATLSRRRGSCREPATAVPRIRGPVVSTPPQRRPRPRPSGKTKPAVRGGPGRTSARLDAVRAGRDHHGGGHRVPDRATRSGCRSSATTCASPTRPSSSGWRTTAPCCRRPTGGTRSARHGDHHRHLGRHRAGARHGPGHRHAPHDLRPGRRPHRRSCSRTGSSPSSPRSAGSTPGPRTPATSRRCSATRAAHQPRPGASPSSSSPRCGRRRRSWRCCSWPAWRSCPRTCRRRPRSTGRRAWQRFRPRHAAADEAGDPRRAAVPHARRVPDLRQHLHPDRRRPQHRLGVDPRLRQPLHRAQPRHRLGHLGPHLHLRRDHRRSCSSRGSAPPRPERS